jgi:hypothetical protein
MAKRPKAMEEPLDDLECQLLSLFMNFYSTPEESYRALVDYHKTSAEGWAWVAHE